MKLALRFSPGVPPGGASIRAMLSAQALEPGPPAEVIELAGGALGYLPTSDRLGRVRLVRRGRAGNVLVVSGVPVDLEGSLDAELGRIADLDHRAAATALARLDGAFAAAFWDQAARKLAVVSDFLGMQPLYELPHADGLVMATEVKGLAAIAAGGQDLDPAGWGTFVGLGFVAEELTLLRAASRVPPASVTVYDPIDGRTERSTYWRWPAPRPELRLEDVDTGALADLLTRHITACVEHHAGGTVLLSGGFDSRLILCALARAGIRPAALILSHSRHHDDADGRFATAIAEALGIATVFMHPGIGFFASAEYLDYVVASEVSAPSLELFIAQLPMHLRPEMGAVWEGVAPGYSLPTPHQPPGGFDSYLAQEASLPGSRRWKAAARVFAPAVAGAMEEAFRDAVAGARAAYADDGFGVSEFIIRNRMRNRTAPNPLKVYANRVLPFTPGLSKAFWAVAASVPYELKARFRLYLALYARHFPEGARAPFISGSTVVKSRPGLDTAYYATLVRSQLMRVPYVGGAIRRLGLRPRLVREESPLVDRVLEHVDPAHPDLNADGVRPLISAAGSPDPERNAARQLLFYWQAWRWIMDGSIRGRYAALLGTRATPARLRR
ncbi:MAG: hypothetical protein L0027_05405 [Candidatus Rokubacteria bacterium]|nr:hypothetical protein [Candidatus Rokubacteria bacterium]